MRIGIDARALSGRFTGDRTYWRGLLGALSEADACNEYALYLRQPIPDGEMLSLGPNFRISVLPAPNDRVWSFWAFPRALRTDNITVAHVQYTVPPSCPCPVVTTVHDVTFRLFPKLFAFKDQWLLNASLPGSLRRAARVIAVSENTRRDILRCYPFVPPGKVVTTLLAADKTFQPPAEQESARLAANTAYGFTGPYALAVGVLQPRKNLPLLIRAFQKAKAQAGLKQTLIVAGKAGWLSQATEQALADARNAVRLIGYVPDGDLPILYGGADAFCYPSLYEGFGLPPLEAMACGCPVLVSHTSSLPEVVGDAGVVLSPSDEQGWQDGLMRVLCDEGLRRQMSSKGRAQAARFSWAETARGTLRVYESVEPVLKRDNLERDS